MPVKNEGYWTKVFPCEIWILPDEGHGKWIVYLRRNFNKAKIGQRRTVIKDVEEFVIANNLIGAYVKSNTEDVILFFTTADRFEINSTRLLIQSRFKVKNEDMFRKPHHETDEDWERNQGTLWFINSLVTGYGRKEAAIKNKRPRKADAIQRNDIDRTIARYMHTHMKNKTETRTTMVIQPSFPSIDYAIEPKLVFVAMPFGESWSNDVMFIIKNVGEELGFNVKRADDIFNAGIIVNDIWSLINKAGLIIADITVHNANVFYELGICHTLGKEVVLIRKKGGEQSPFDISLWRYFEYELTPTLAEEFKGTLRKILSNYISKHNIS